MPPRGVKKPTKRARQHEHAQDYRGRVELAQVLRTPEHFEQASELVTEELAVADVPCGPDVAAHLEAIAAYERAGFDELYVNQIGPERDVFFAAYGEHVLPRVRR